MPYDLRKWSAFGEDQRKRQSGDLASTLLGTANQTLMREYGKWESMAVYSRLRSIRDYDVFCHNRIAYQTEDEGKIIVRDLWTNVRKEYYFDNYVACEWRITEKYIFALGYSR